MGYTHYFRQQRDLTPEEFAKIGEAIGAIIDQGGIRIVREYDRTAEPAEITAQAIAFNGPHEHGHETFLLVPKIELPEHWPESLRGFHFCKTAYKPYDLIVVASLCAVHHIAPGAYEISSDGGPDDWKNGLELARRVLGPGVANPIEPGEDNDSDLGDTFAAGQAFFAETDMVPVPRSALITIVGAAESYRDDLESGLDDGTYEDTEDEPNSQRIDDLEAALKLIPPLGDPPELPQSAASSARPRLRMVCEECGSEDVLRDAWAEWDEDAQDWTLSTTFDNAHCNACDGECNIEAVRINAAGQRIDDQGNVIPDDEEEAAECPRCGNTDNDGSDVCPDCGEGME